MIHEADPMPMYLPLYDYFQRFVIDLNPMDL